MVKVIKPTRKKATRKKATRKRPPRLSRSRDNRILAHYLMIQCWLHQLDCIVLTRQNLLDFFGLKTVHRRSVNIGFHNLVDVFKDDISPWFPYAFKVYPYYGFRPKAEGYEDPPPVDSLWLSRHSNSDELGDGKMSDKARLENLCRCGIETDMAKNILPNGKIPTVDEMLTELALIGAGVGKPSIKKKRQRKRKPLKWVE